LPPAVRQASERLNEQVVRPVLRGEKKVSFAVTEPGGGSDVNAITTRAEPTGDGWLLSGEKTLISGAMRADYILTAARTASGDQQGISLLLVDAHSEGVQREPVNGLRWYNASLGTIRFNRTRVRSAYLIGPEHRGFMQLLPQFNIERFSGVAATLGMPGSALPRPSLSRGKDRYLASA
jgi:acyl-CoA dehydrogenase